MTSEWDPWRCCGSSKEGAAPRGQAPGAQSQAHHCRLRQAGATGWIWLPSFYLPSQGTSMLMRTDLVPLHSLSTGVTPGLCHPLSLPHPLRKLRRQILPLLDADGTQSIAGPLSGRWMAGELHQDGGPPAGGNDPGEKRLD